MEPLFTNEISGITPDYKKSEKTFSALLKKNKVILYKAGMIMIILLMFYPRVKRVSGVISLLGEGKWKGGITQHSVIEIGNKKLRSIQVDDYLSNYLKFNQECTLYLIKGSTKWFLAALKVHGKTYKVSKTRFLGAIIYKLVLVTFLVGTVSAFLHLGIYGSETMFINLLVLLGLIGSIISFIRFLAI